MRVPGCTDRPSRASGRSVGEYADARDWLSRCAAAHDMARDSGTHSGVSDGGRRAPRQQFHLGRVHEPAERRAGPRIGARSRRAGTSEKISYAAPSAIGSAGS